jgi:dihydrolipoamide dehydrogenase
MRYDYDLLVIGSGAGGSAGAHIAAGMGKRVAIIEKHIVGGECPNYACVPTKALLHAADVYQTVQRAAEYGTKVTRSTLDYKAVRKWKNLVVSRTGTMHGEDVFRKAGIHLISGTAKFISNHEVMVSGRSYSADKFIIATGSSTIIPPIPGIEDIGYDSYDTMADLDRLPKSIFIVGGGAVGCEFVQIFATFGSKVTIADSAPRLLVKEDVEVGELIEALFANRGVTILPKTMVTRFTKQGSKKIVHYETSGKSHSCAVERILIATGKKPNIDLDLERAGIMVNKHGIRINQYLQTTAPNIYAAGDVVGPFLFTHTGTHQSHIAAHNAFSYKKIRIDYRVVPKTVFTNPEVASVGISEEEAKEKGIRIKKGLVPVVALGRSNTSNEMDGFVKVITDANETIIGACMVAPRAGELIHELAMAVKFRATADEVAEMIHAYPTFSEAVKLACDVVE